MMSITLSPGPGGDKRAFFKSAIGVGSGLGAGCELRRTPSTRSSQNTPAGHWCENSLGAAPFSWLRGGPARAMDHLGEYRREPPAFEETRIVSLVAALPVGFACRKRRLAFGSDAKRREWIGVGRIVVSSMVALDGVMGSPERWAFP